MNLNLEIVVYPPWKLTATTNKNSVLGTIVSSMTFFQVPRCERNTLFFQGFFGTKRCKVLSSSGGVLHKAIGLSTRLICAKPLQCASTDARGKGDLQGGKIMTPIFMARSCDTFLFNILANWAFSLDQRFFLVPKNTAGHIIDTVEHPTDYGSSSWTT